MEGGGGRGVDGGTRPRAGGVVGLCLGRLAAVEDAHEGARFGNEGWAAGASLTQLRRVHAFHVPGRNKGRR